MIISRTPFRVSFVGGGTDLRSYYSIEPGNVLSTGIDKYIYVVAKRQLGIVEYKYRVNWSRVEFRHRIDDIEHPIVREALKMLEIDFPLEITTFADIPANTGLGSSSAFAVGLLHVLYALRGEMVTKYQLASQAAEIEMDILGRTVGKQDHFAAAYGNVNVYTFNPDETVTVEPVLYQPEAWRTLGKNMLLFYTRLKRDASEILKEQDAATGDKLAVLRQMKDLVPELREVISAGTNLQRIGEILHEGWELKRTLAGGVSSCEIDAYYRQAREAGAVGGKVLGAGGGGFLLFYVEAERQDAVIEALKDLYVLRIGLDQGGTRITYYDQAGQ